MNNGPALLFALVFGIVIVVYLFSYLSRRLQNRERLMAIEKGVSVPVVTAIPIDPVAKARRTRQSALLLIAAGIAGGITFAGAFLFDRQILSTAGFAIIPLVLGVAVAPFFLGVAFLVDYLFLKRELEKEKEQQ
ncbi:MAG: hypothetical protein ACLPLR_15005 [Terriglobales bacterium]